MKTFIFWTGLLSLASGAALQFHDLVPYLMPTERPGMLLHVFGGMAMFMGTMLMLCTRDLLHRAPLVVWQGVLRVFGFAIMAGYGLWGGGGMLLVAAGLFDLAVGVAYLAGVPRHLGLPLRDVLLDRMVMAERRAEF